MTLDIFIADTDADIQACFPVFSELGTVKHLAPASTEVYLFTELGNLPLYNPGLENSPPAIAAQLHNEVASADALLVASPKYAHGATGTIKNALDWLVAFEGFAYKPVAVLNATSRAHNADVALVAER